MAKGLLTLRPGTPGAARLCGRICYEAFGTLAEHHRFPPDFSSPEHAAETLGRLLAHPRFYSVVAELDGRVVGSNFLDERSTIAGLGPARGGWLLVSSKASAAQSEGESKARQDQIKEGF